MISYKDDIKHKFHEMRNKIERGDEVFKTEEWKNMKKLLEIIYVFLTIFLYLLKCPQSLIL